MSIVLRSFSIYDVLSECFCHVKVEQVLLAYEIPSYIEPYVHPWLHFHPQPYSGVR